MKVYPEITSLFSGTFFDVANSHILRKKGVTDEPVGLSRHDSILVQLTPEECVNAMTFAVANALVHDPDAPVVTDARTMICRAALAKAASKNTMDEIDAEVRHVPVPTARLSVFANEPEHRPYILIIGTGLVYEIAGWMTGSEIMTKDRAVSNSEWAVPIKDLRPIKELMYAKHAVEDERLRIIINPPSKVKVPMDMELELLRRPTSVDELWQMAKVAYGRA